MVYTSVHMSPNLAMGEGAFEGSDYSDFEYQFVHAATSIRGIGSDTNVGQGSLNRFDVLEGNGGLNNNEVAELVYYELQASTEFEDENVDQDVATSLQMRGTFGANLPNSGLAGIHPPAGQIEDGEVFEESGDASTRVAFRREKVDNRIFQIFSANQGVPFDDGTNGPGGSSSFNTFEAERNYRQLTGRGPVLDSTDDLNVFIDINAGDVVSQIRGEVRLHMVWDTAEVSDAGRAFSVPDM